MAIRSITRGEFQLLMPSHELLRCVVGEQVDWYVDESETVIGTVAAGKTDGNWVYVVLGRERTGMFRAVAMNRTMESREEAGAELLQAMSAVQERKSKSLVSQA